VAGEVPLDHGARLLALGGELLRQLPAGQQARRVAPAAAVQAQQAVVEPHHVAPLPEPLRAAGPRLDEGLLGAGIDAEQVEHAHRHRRAGAAGPDHANGGRLLHEALFHSPCVPMLTETMIAHCCEPMDDRWGDTEAWVGEELRREAFFFPSGGGRLYGSLYAAASPSRSSGVVICNSWGFEANQADQTMHRTALAMARAGGAGLIFHYPGFGDSEGDLGEATMDALADAAVDAVEEASRRLPGTRWTLVGLMLGASVAALAARRAGAERLLLIQPALQPSRYFSRLERSAKRAAVRVPARAGNAYGYPLPRPILEAAPAIDAAVAAALAEFDGEGAVISYVVPPGSELIPSRFEQIQLPGAWRFGSRQKPELARAARKWLQRPEAEAKAVE
jgi:uncharacterized protein